MREFPASPITALIDQTPRYNLGESTGADLTVAELLGPDDPERVAGLAGVRLGYGTSAGDPELRALVAARHGIPDGQVLITPARRRPCSWSRCCAATARSCSASPAIRRRSAPCAASARRW